MAARRTITTVTAAASDTTLTTLSIVKDELGITGTDQDAKLMRYIKEASAAAQQFCNRIFAVQTYQDDFWPTRDFYPTMIPGGEEPLQLSNWPISDTSNITVTENDVALTKDVDFTIDADRGQLTRLDTATYPKKWPAYHIAVVYKAGYATVPDDVAGKIVRMVTGRFYASGRDPALMSENIPGVREYRVWVPSGEDAGNMPPDVADVLNNYRVPVIR